MSQGVIRTISVGGLEFIVSKTEDDHVHALKTPEDGTAACGKSMSRRFYPEACDPICEACNKWVLSKALN
jgi:hypothetical protein